MTKKFYCNNCTKEMSNHEAGPKYVEATWEDSLVTAKLSLEIKDNDEWELDSVHVCIPCKQSKCIEAIQAWHKKRLGR